MDDYDVNTLVESKNEWCARLLNILTPQIIIGFKSIFNEAQKLCIDNDEDSKYLMTFQNLLVNIPKWSQNIVETECKRITDITNCNYIEDLISCVHIIQLKALTACRVGLKQKKINIEIPNLSNFIHQVYINCARKLYLNIYLFEIDILPLQLQKNNRELELIIKEIIMNTIRDNIPIDNLLRAYLDETEETETIVEERQETVIDKQKLDEEKARMKMKREMEEEEEKKRTLTKNKKDSDSENKNELLNISAELEDLRKELPQVNITKEETIIEKQQDISLGKETNNITIKDIDSNSNDSKKLTEINNNDAIDNEILKINDIGDESPLEITNLDEIDNLEPDISLDIEELK
tara:strand:+ start:2013 stop:3065 length:1053 start_codon:yes stop_codon:yes gene_type:complete